MKVPFGHMDKLPAADDHAALKESAALREHAARDQSEAARLTSRAARRLHEEEGLPLRDVGIALGISYQRAHQLVDEARELADA